MSAKGSEEFKHFRFLTKKFIDTLEIVYKEFGVISYEFIGNDKFSILRLGEVIVNRLNDSNIEKIHTILVDLEIDRVMPRTNLLIYQSTKYENNTFIDVESSNQIDKATENKIKMSGFGKKLSYIEISQSGLIKAFVYSDKLVLLLKNKQISQVSTHFYNNLHVRLKDYFFNVLARTFYFC